jgi:hypothetical protein
VLGNYLYTKMKNKDTTIRKFRLWKTPKADDITIADQQFKKQSVVMLDAELVNDIEDKEGVTYEDLNLLEEDILVVELPKGKDFIVKKKEKAIRAEDLEEMKITHNVE